ncbi:hypothetical protein [Winogradskyella sp.]|uniref:hypothetical protein n=1 Tax=Winogradskyella sp. TaxID=1883156 RepID=UPI003517CC3A
MPLGESMASALKSNKSIKIDKSKRFRKTPGGYAKNRKVKYELPKATPEQLQEIKTRIKRENKIMWIKVVLLSTVIIIALVWVLLTS